VALNRTERTLAFIIAGIIGLSLLAIVALFIAGAAGVVTNTGIWPSVVVLPLIGLPIGLLLIVVFLIISTMRRRRLAQDAGR
jgi:hypothetical protein